MSKKAINRLLGRALLDDHFAEKLLANPLRTAQEAGYDLTLEEQAILQNARAKDVAELSQILLTQLKDNEQHE